MLKLDNKIIQMIQKEEAWTNLKKIETDCFWGFWQPLLALPSVLQSFFLLDTKL